MQIAKADAISTPTHMTVQQPKLVTKISSIVGNGEVGSTLSAGTVTPAEATVTYQWLRGSSESLLFEYIANATDDTYTLTEEDAGRYIKVNVAGIGLYGGGASSTAFFVPRVQVPLPAPTPEPEPALVPAPEPVPIPVPEPTPTQEQISEPEPTVFNTIQAGTYSNLVISEDTLFLGDVIIIGGLTILKDAHVHIGVESWPSTVRLINGSLSVFGTLHIINGGMSFF